MNELDFKSYVTEKFKSVKRFAKTVGIDSLDVYAVFRMKDGKAKTEKLDQLYSLAKKIKAKKFKHDWKPGLGNKIRKAIINKHDHIILFCKKYPEFTNSWISLIVKDKRETITPKVERLCKILKVNYGVK